LVLAGQAWQKVLASASAYVPGGQVLQDWVLKPAAAPLNDPGMQAATPLP
jgi:hypothetical protein